MAPSKKTAKTPVPASVPAAVEAPAKPEPLDVPAPVKVEAASPPVTVQSTYTRARDLCAKYLPVALLTVLVSYADKLAAVCPIKIPGRKEDQTALAALDELLLSYCAQADDKLSATVARVTGRVETVKAQALELKADAEKKVEEVKAQALELKADAEKKVEEVKASAEKTCAQALEFKVEAIKSVETAKQYVPAVKAVVIDTAVTTATSISEEIKKEGLYATANSASQIAKSQATEVYQTICRDGVVAYAGTVKDAVVDVIVEADAKLAAPEEQTQQPVTAPVAAK